MRRSLAVLAVASLTAFIVVASALAAGAKVKAMPGTYDPDKTGIVVAAWQAHAGLPDAGGSDHGLVLQKNGPTATNAAAGASIVGAEGQTVVPGPTFGWDYKNGGQCGAGSPRFNVQASDGFHFLGGCANSTQSAAAPGWTRVRIDPSNPAQAFPPIAAGATIQSVTLIVDEEGQVVVDNIVANGNAPIEKPGNNG
jgi:hypothetical protein